MNIFDWRYTGHCFNNISTTIGFFICLFRYFYFSSSFWTISCRNLVSASSAYPSGQSIVALSVSAFSASQAPCLAAARLGRCWSWATPISDAGYLSLQFQVVVIDPYNVRWWLLNVTMSDGGYWALQYQIVVIDCYV